MASLRSLRAGLRRSQLGDRYFHDFIRGSTQGSTYKVPLSSQKIVGLCTSRGSRPEQEDAASVHALQLSPGELQTSLDKLKEKIAWKPEHAGSDFLASQVAFFGIYDGHGGKEVSKYLKENLHSLLETVQPDSIGETVQWMVNTHEGYYRRWRGGRLQRWTRFSQSNLPDLGSGMTLEERITLAFLEADRQVLTTIDKAKLCGSTASVVLLHSLDEPCEPYWASKKLAVTIGHTGDTRVLLCPRETGQVIPLTEKHHAESRVEATRLRRMGTGNLVSDSFGESRWMGMIENTRGFGDGEFKPSGVTAEPEVHTRVLNGEDYSYIVLVTDGLTSLMSDQEIIDLARESIDPTRAAKSIVHFGEDLGAQDNCTCIVIPLAGWGKVGGKDTTEERREYRKKQAGMMSTRMSRM